MNSNANLKNLSEYLRENKPFKLYYKNEFFAEFNYDREKNRYQSDCGYLSTKKVFEISKGLESDRRILWER